MIQNLEKWYKIKKNFRKSRKMLENLENDTKSRKMIQNLENAKNLDKCHKNLKIC